MQSERYIVTLFGVDVKYYTNDYIAYLWEASANREYNRSNIFVTGLVDVRRLICGKIRGCTLGETAHVISTVRNPVEAEDEKAFYESFKNIVGEVKQNLNNPSMTVTIQKTDYYYFV